ncbi:hypothetical protein ISCGN_001181 [Ixodes scapularis]
MCVPSATERRLRHHFAGPRSTCPDARLASPSIILEHFPEVEGSLVEILKLSARSVEDTICRDVLNSMITQVSRAVNKERLVGLLAAMKEPRQVFHHMAASFVGLRISLKAFDFLAALSDRLQEQYVAHILLLCDVEDMALDTEGQSQNPGHVVDCLASMLQSNLQIFTALGSSTPIIPFGS